MNWAILSCTHVNFGVGTVAIYNSRLVHRGSANTATDARLIRPNFMFSLMERGTGAKSRKREGALNKMELKPPDGQTYALDPEYGNVDEGFRLGLADFVNL